MAFYSFKWTLTVIVVDPYEDTFLSVLSLLFLDVGEASSIFTREWIASARAFI